MLARASKKTKCRLKSLQEKQNMTVHRMQFRFIFYYKLYFFIPFWNIHFILSFFKVFRTSYLCSPDMLQGCLQLILKLIKLFCAQRTQIFSQKVSAPFQNKLITIVFLFSSTKHWGPRCTNYNNLIVNNLWDRCRTSTVVFSFKYSW